MDEEMKEEQENEEQEEGLTRFERTVVTAYRTDKGRQFQARVIWKPTQSKKKGRGRPRTKAKVQAEPQNADPVIVELGCENAGTESFPWVDRKSGKVDEDWSDKFEFQFSIRGHSPDEAFVKNIRENLNLSVSESSAKDFTLFCRELSSIIAEDDTAQTDALIAVMDGTRYDPFMFRLRQCLQNIGGMNFYLLKGTEKDPESVGKSAEAMFRDHPTWEWLRDSGKSDSKSKSDSDKGALDWKLLGEQLIDRYRYDLSQGKNYSRTVFWNDTDFPAIDCE
jgi:hypothetical protein